MTDTPVVSMSSLKIACGNCSLTTLCLPFGLSNEDIDKLDAIVRRSRPLQRNDHLYREGDHFANVYVIKSGAVKTYCQSREGNEQILGFHLPGELIGLDAIQNEVHGCSAKVLETSAVCELPFAELERLSAEIPSLQHQLFRLLSKEIAYENEMLALLGNSTAEQRVATFLVNMSTRFGRRGFSETDFFLSMSRQEIGSYLGLALETVSRLFTRFQDEGLLQVNRKHIEIKDIGRLRHLTVDEALCDRPQLTG